mmetsp:Transcript_12550/g.23887  ORF Transcript_12550/g.23887 Transcript_12550/m.23887 type:complete len:86 (-) Transcript_12550:92-349(-)
MRSLIHLRLTMFLYTTHEKRITIKIHNGVAIRIQMKNKHLFYPFYIIEKIAVLSLPFSANLNWSQMRYQSIETDKFLMQHSSDQR